jgi:hypothetical protein
MTKEVTLSNIESLLDETIEKKIEPIMKRRFDAQEAKRFRQMSLVIAMLSVIGIGTIGGWVTGHVNNEVERRVELATAETVDKISLSGFAVLANQLSNSDTFSRAQEQGAVDYLKSFQGKRDILDNPEFEVSLKKVVEALVQADRVDSLREIFGMYREEIPKDQKALVQLTHHFGQTLVGRPYTPENDETLENFEYLERFVRTSNYPEVPMVYRILFTANESSESVKPDVIKMIKASQGLSKPDGTSFFFNLIDRAYVENWASREIMNAVAMEQSIRTFFSTYGDELQATYPNLSDELLSMITSGEIRGDENVQAVSQIIMCGEVDC